MKIKAGVIGGAGYTGGELIRLLLLHPDVEIVFVHSKSNAGNHLYEVHTDLVGETDLKFTSQLTDQIDVLFLCVGHGEAKKFLTENKISNHIKMIDLSQDFRLKPAVDSKLSVKEVTTGEIQDSDFIYGLPELNHDSIQGAQNIANPGCFATCIQLGLLPLAAHNLLSDEVHISATTGSTGAGQSLSSTSHFSWRTNNLSVYKAFEHQHLAEISQSIRQLQPGCETTINFIPHRGNFSRGIMASIYVACNVSIDRVLFIYEEFYGQHPFVHLSKKEIDLKQVVNTNKCIIHLEKFGDKLFINSIIDNLLKGASGQAVQNMNIMFGIEETTGLKLKASAF